jgi:multidrug resistance protein, MATE family
VGIPRVTAVMAARPQPIASGSNNRSSLARSPFSTSSSPLAEESIARDIAECSEYEVAITIDGDEEDASEPESELSDSSTVRPAGPSHSMASSYRRPSFMAFGASRPTVTPHPDVSFLTKKERVQAWREERSLLRDNHLAPPKHPEPRQRSTLSRIYRRLFSPRQPIDGPDAESAEPPFTAEPSETSALLVNGIPEPIRDGLERRNRQ